MLPFLDNHERIALQCPEHTKRAFWKFRRNRASERILELPWCRGRGPESGNPNSREQFLADHPKVRLHFTPTYSSWLNQVEIWFAKIERDVIARGVFTSVSDLGRKLMKYIRAHAERARPIRWTYTDVKRRITAKGITGTAQ